MKHTVPDIHTGPLLVVRTSFVDAEAEDLRGTILDAFANQPVEHRPELVLEALRAEDLDEASRLEKTMREAHAGEIPDQQRVKVVRLADATAAELAAVVDTAIAIADEVDDLVMVFAALVPDLPVVFAGRLAARLHQMGYRVIAPATSAAGAA